jgi:hypothetical protein
VQESDCFLEEFGGLFLVGNVPSQDRRDLAERVAAELVCGRLRVVNALAVECYPDPADPEPLE